MVLGFNLAANVCEFNLDFSSSAEEFEIVTL